MQESIVRAWTTNDRVTVFLVERMPMALWEAGVPGQPRKTMRMIAAHLHNVRCRWIKTLGSEHGIPVPKQVDRHTVTSEELVKALGESGAGIRRVLELGSEHGGTVPDSKGYVWRNLPLDVGHVLGYFVAHEGHHRGQIVMLARQMGMRLPGEVTDGLWQWTKLSRG
jgi:uncharacterized damage-inducible protein DinB